MERRYIEFHPTLPIAYVVNELSSEVAVFRFNKEKAKELIATMEDEGKDMIHSVISPDIQITVELNRAHATYGYTRLVKSYYVILFPSLQEMWMGTRRHSAWSWCR